MNTSLGRLERVELRQAWLSETVHFTPWLAQCENLKLLGEAIGLELQCEAQEKDVGPFRADILCKDTATDQWVLIENQLERTDHSHLGQLITYAAGLEAVTVVWVAEHFTEEHRAALDWLNEHTDENITFFGLEIELWRIGDSPVAPKFNVVCKPNDWTRANRKRAGLSEYQQKQLDFWTAFQSYVDGKKTSLRCQTPQPRHWMTHAIGKAGFCLHSVATYWDSETSTKGPELRVEFAIKHDEAKRDFAVIVQKRAEIERAIGEPVRWHNPANAKVCIVSVRNKTEVMNESLWPQHHQWLLERLERFQRIFGPLIKDLEASAPPREGAIW